MKNHIQRLRRIEAAAVPKGFDEAEARLLTDAVTEAELDELIQACGGDPNESLDDSEVKEPTDSPTLYEAIFEGNPELEAKARARVKAWREAGSSAWIWDWVKKNPDPE